MNELPPELSPTSTYLERHRKYYQRYKKLIQARNKRYKREYNKRWYLQNRDRLLAEAQAKRDNDKLRRLVEREKLLQEAQKSD